MSHSSKRKKITDIFSIKYFYRTIIFLIILICFSGCTDSDKKYNDFYFSLIDHLEGSTVQSRNFLQPEFKDFSLQNFSWKETKVKTNKKSVSLSIVEKHKNLTTGFFEVQFNFGNKETLPEALCSHKPVKLTDTIFKPIYGHWKMGKGYIYNSNVQKKI